MASSIFGNTGGSSIAAAIKKAKELAGSNPQALYNTMYQTNPEFRQFADSMQGKTPQQAFRENGLDYDQLRGLF